MTPKVKDTLRWGSRIARPKGAPLTVLSRLHGLLLVADEHGTPGSIPIAALADYRVLR